MPIGRSAKKSLRKAVKNKKSNVSFKIKVKNAIKAFLLKPTEKALVEVQSILDKSKKKNIFHKNKIDRIKSRMSKKIVKKVTPKK